MIILQNAEIDLGSVAPSTGTDNAGGMWAPDVAVAAVHGEDLKPSEGIVLSITLCWNARMCSRLRSSVFGR